jgi:hypothetical protein
MTEQHPLTLSPELVQLWKAQYYDYNKTFSELVTEVAQYGADQELEACVQTLKDQSWYNVADDLHAARRPKPPSLKEQALEDLASIEANCGHLTRPETLLQSRRVANIRRALEALPE